MIACSYLHMKCNLPLLFLMLLCRAAFSQQDSIHAPTRSIHPMIEVGVMTGGEVSNGLFIYRNAKVAELSINLKSRSRIYYGAGAGIEGSPKGMFVPVFLQFKGMANKKSVSSFISIQAGYGFSRAYSSYRVLNVEQKGGLFFSPGIGYKLAFDHSIVLLSINYKHQFMKMVYTGLAPNSYTHDSNLHMVSFKAGWLLD